MHIQKKFRVITLAIFLCLSACHNAEEVDPIKHDGTDANSSTGTPELVISKESDLYGINEYDDSMWKTLYDQADVAAVELDTKGRVWILLGNGDIALIEENNWKIFTSEDYGFDGFPSDLELAIDGTAWIVGNDSLSRYKDDEWETFKIPGPIGSDYIDIAVDPSGNVWAAGSECEDNMYLFKNMAWEIHKLPEECIDVDQLLSAPDGTLWATFYYRGGIYKFNNGDWTVYTGEDFSLATGGYYGVKRISLDDSGNLFGLYSGYKLDIIKIGVDGSLSTLSFEPNTPYINPHVLRIYVDRSNMVWVNACPSNEWDSCLAYYNGNSWTYFTNLPISSTFDIKQKPNGSMLIASGTGLYQLNYK